MALRISYTETSKERVVLSDLPRRRRERKSISGLELDHADTATRAQLPKTESRKSIFNSSPSNFSLTIVVMVCIAAAIYALLL